MLVMSIVVLILKWIFIIWLLLGIISTAAMIGIILIEGEKEIERETEDNRLS